MAANETSIQTVDQCMKIPAFQSFCKETSIAHPNECRSLDLNAFLIKPIQR